MGIYTYFNIFILAMFTALVLFRFIVSRYSTSITVIVSLAVNLLVFSLSAFLIYSNGYDLSRPFTFILLLGINILLSMRLSVNRDYRAFFSAVLVISMGMAVESLAQVIYTASGSAAAATIISIVAYGITAYFSISWLAPVTGRLMVEMPGIWGKLWLVPCSFIVLHFLLAIEPADTSASPSIMPALIALILIQIFIYYFIFSFYHDFMKVLKERRNIQAKNSLAAMVSDQQAHLQEIEERVRVFRHDTKHYVQMLKSCLDSGEIDAAKKMLKALDSDISDSTHLKRYASEPLLNAVLSNYASRTSAADIRMDTRIRLLETLPVNEMDFSIVLSNALENAYHACLSLAKERNPFISVTVTCDESRLFLEVKNSYSGTIFFDQNGKLPVTFDENHGIGTRSISSFAEKNGAILDYNTDDGIFTMHMLLYITEQEVKK
ncbi:MAG: GHKL domain-containing protein [Eubacteriaceae bacterium]|nr:GHKL domain-containing protein [Eubacteriaceae bacterium]